MPAPALMSMVDLVVQTPNEEITAQPGLLWILGQTGVIGAIAGTFAMLHRSAIKAYKDSADKSERIAELERQRADTVNEQLIQLLTPIKNVG